MLLRQCLGVSFSTGGERLPRTCGSVREDERGPADPSDNLQIGGLVGGNKVTTGTDFVRLVPLSDSCSQVVTIIYCALCDS